MTAGRASSPAAAAKPAKAQRTRRQHVVPRFFLARFADGRGRVLVYDKQTGKEHETTPKGAAVELDYYTIETEQGPSDVVERELGKVEASCAEGLREIDAGHFPPSDDARAAISMFMALQFVRGPDFRRMGDNAATQMLRMTGKIAASKPEYVRHVLEQVTEGEVTDEQVARTVESLSRGDVTVELRREQHIATMAHVVDDLVPFFYRRKWFLVQTSGLSTSDLPVSLWARPRSGFWRGVGVMTADEIAMAIAPDRALLLAHPDEVTGGDTGPERVVEIKPGREDNLRGRLWLHAYRFTYRTPGLPQPNVSDEPAR